MKDQALYNKLSRHLLTQMATSLNLDKTHKTLYHGPKNLKSPAGVFIPKSKYKRSYESKDLSLLARGVLKDQFKDLNLDIIDAFETTYWMHKPDQWAFSVYVIACLFNLKQYKCGT